MKYTCPCCGYKTLNEEPPGTYDICSICFWKMMEFSILIPTMRGGTNIPSLRQAQKNYVSFGACEERCIEFVRRANENDEKDLKWKEL